VNAITYLIYIIFWELLTLGGSSYVVFVLERSGWWMFLGIILGGCAYKPGLWIHGKKWIDC
jgi:hypothetical protein